MGTTLSLTTGCPDETGVGTIGFHSNLNYKLSYFFPILIRPRSWNLGAPMVVSLVFFFLLAQYALYLSCFVVVYIHSYRFQLLAISSYWERTLSSTQQVLRYLNSLLELTQSSKFGSTACTGRKMSFRKRKSVQSIKFLHFQYIAIFHGTEIHKIN